MGYCRACCQLQGGREAGYRRLTVPCYLSSNNLCKQILSRYGQRILEETWVWILSIFDPWLTEAMLMLDAQQVD